MSELAWNCDFCNRSGLTISQAGIVYCKYCGLSYGESLFDKLPEEAMKGLISALEDLKARRYTVFTKTKQTK